VRPTTAAAGAAALLLAAGIAACSSDPEPGSPLPTGEPVPSATGSAEPTGASPSTAADPSASPTEEPVAAPTLPPEATTNDAAGAEAFTRYWYETLNFAYSTGDLEPMRRASADECVICDDLAGVISESYADGGRLKGGLVTLSEVVAPTPDATGSVLLSVVFQQAGSQQVDASGAVEAEYPSETDVSASVVIERTDSDDGWRMYGVGA